MEKDISSERDRTNDNEKKEKVEWMQRSISSTNPFVQDTHI